MEEKYGDYIKRKKQMLSRTSTSSKRTRKLRKSNSDTNFFVYQQTERRTITYENLKKKSKIQQHEHKDCEYCDLCHNYSRIERSNKNMLSDYIQDNLKGLRLFGNYRYKNTSPIKFVEDNKAMLPNNQMGLVPLPSHAKKRQGSTGEKTQLYNVQRNIVMLRRMQYNKKITTSNYYSNLNTIGQTAYYNESNNYASEMRLIQRWWKHLNKIVLLQKTFRGYLIRKQVNSIVKLNDFMKNFEGTLIIIYLRQAFFKIKSTNFLSKNLFIGHKNQSNSIKNPNDCGFASKERKYLSENLREKIVKIQNATRQMRARKKKSLFLRESKFTVRNSNAFISKKILSVSRKKAEKNILKIQRCFREYIRFVKDMRRVPVNIWESCCL